MPFLWQKKIFSNLYIYRRSTRKVFINKISGVSNVGFKGYQHVKNDVGETVMKFNYPYDSNKETCEIQIFKVTPTEKYNYIIDEKSIATIPLKPEGVEVNLQNITNLAPEEPFAYKVVRKDKDTGKVVWEGPDTGVHMRKSGDEYVFKVHQDKGFAPVEKDGKVVSGKFVYGGDPDEEYRYSLVTRKGTTPMVQGAAYLAMPDSLRPGMKYYDFDASNTGETYYDKEYQKKMEGVIKNFSNRYGGNLAGVKAQIPYLKQNKYKIMFLNPIANGDDVSAHGYWNKNNMQLALTMGNMENYTDLVRELYKNGLKYVYDGTYTSEGLEGIHFQYALRWADQKPQSYYWFRMSGIKNSNIGLGVVPENKEVLRHRLVNAPYKYELQSDGTYKAVANKEYNPKKETYVQVYDVSQVSDGQLDKLDTPIRVYENLTSGNEISKITYDDSLISYVCQIDPKEYQKRIDVINELNKKFNKNIRLDTPDGTLMACQFSNFKFTKESSHHVTWDANKDMVKMNYVISGYDEKNLQEIVDDEQRYYEQERVVRGNKEVQDLMLQSMRYWTQISKDVQTLYTAKTVGSAKTKEALDKLIADEKLPQEANLSAAALNNILNGHYKLEPKGVLDKQDVTVKALMKMPLDGLEFGENTVGVLSTSFFSNRATTDDTVGLTRFELLKQKNPHLVEPYTKVYERVDSLFQNEIKQFAENIIKKVDEQSNEKLLDSNGDYTEYGEYVMDLIGKDITKYAMFKALRGDGLKTKILPSGEITYDYNDIKANTTLKALNIRAYTPEDEALQLEKKIEKGLKKLDESDISYVADSVSKRIAGVDTTSFRIAEAMVAKASLGLDWRLDAVKDLMDMDSVRNEDDDFCDNFNDLIKLTSKAVKTIKSVDSNSYIVAEVTDIPDLIRDTTGYDVYPNANNTNIGQIFNGDPDAQTKLFNESGITSEAAYSYFYTNVLNTVSRDFEQGGAVNAWIDDYKYAKHDTFRDRIDILLKTRGLDYLRNLFTFIGNHDKPRMIHGLALDMEMFHHNNGQDKSVKQRHITEAFKILTNSDSVEDIPIELRLCINNPVYMRTVNMKAAAMAKLLRDIVNEDLKGIATEDDIKNLNAAFVDLVNGNYLGEGKNINYQRINIKELSSLNGAFDKILQLAENHGLKLSESERKKLLDNVVKTAKQKDLSNYLVNKDLDYKEGIENEEKERNNAYASEILGARNDYSRYSLYTIQLARLLRDSYKEYGNNPAITSAIKDFAELYDKKTVDQNSIELPMYEDTNTTMKKIGFATRNIRVAMKMAIKEAEYKSGKPIENKDAIVDTVFKSATEPALVKASMLMEHLSALFGIPGMYGGDELVETGYEEKAKNIYLQNRAALPWTEVEEDSIIGNYRKNAMKLMNGTLLKRSNPELHALNDGTPYALDVMANSKDRSETQARIMNINRELKELDKQEHKDEKKIEALKAERSMLTKDLAKYAYMMQSANGDVTVSVFYAGDVDHDSRVDYFAKYGLDTEEKRQKFFKDNNIESINPHNKYIPIQPKTEMDAIIIAGGVAIPIGTIFVNENARDKARYVVKEINNKIGIVKEGGGKIIMDGLTSKNGVMVLRKLKNIIFKGGSPYSNKQYSVVSNPYMQKQNAETGKKLYIISK